MRLSFFFQTDRGVIMPKPNHIRSFARLGVMAASTASLVACSVVQTPVVPTMTPNVSLTPVPIPTATVIESITLPQSTPQLTSPSLPVDDKGFADPAFRALWEKVDGPVAAGTASRSWYWGQPIPFGAMKEPYAEAPDGQRLVQYFEKGRMEINDPSADPTQPWYVTSGLLTVELVSGKIQVGADAFESRAPAQIPVTGDLDSPDSATPLYADYTPARLAPVPNHHGQTVKTKFAQGAPDIEINPPVTVTLASYDATSGHNVPDVFINYFDNDLSTLGLNWLYVMGHPISEPYWVQASFGGSTHLVLVQLFERRALSYDPSGPAGQQVQFTNIGLHYYRWRYHDQSGHGMPPSPIADISH